MLIGDNGSGKSSILEAFRIARLAVRGNFIESLSREHVLVNAIRKDSDGLKLDLRVEADGHNLTYSLSIDPTNRSVTHEGIHALPKAFDLRAAATSSSLLQPLVLRGPERMEYPETSTTQQTSTLLSMFDYFGRTPHIEGVALVREALEGIDNHLPFEVSAAWATRSVGRGTAMREPQIIEPSHRLVLFGANLANAYHALRNDFGSEHWRTTLELIQLGLGHEINDIVTPSAGGGHIDLAIDFESIGLVRAIALADGVLTYLAFVALMRLDADRTLLTFDEPETHLHPALLARVVGLLEDAAERYPVVLSTHSDRLLDCLSSPVDAVVVCELARDHSTRLRRLDSEQFDKWRDDYRGVGEIRAEGQLRSILRREGAP